MDQMIERSFTATRLILAPFYLGIIVVLAGLLVKFVYEIIHFVNGLMEATTTTVIGDGLMMVGIVLIAHLLGTIIAHGYDHFMGRTGDCLVGKLTGSVIAIASLQMLRVFLDIGHHTDGELHWTTTIYAIFIGAMLVLGLARWACNRSNG